MAADAQANGHVQNKISFHYFHPCSRQTLLELLHTLFLKSVPEAPPGRKIKHVLLSF